MWVLKNSLSPFFYTLCYITFIFNLRKMTEPDDRSQQDQNNGNADIRKDQPRRQLVQYLILLNRGHAAQPCLYFIDLIWIFYKCAGKHKWSNGSCKLIANTHNADPGSRTFYGT